MRVSPAGSIPAPSQAPTSAVSATATPPVRWCQATTTTAGWWGAIAQQAVPAAEQEEVFGFLGQMDEYHPTEPHWYLPLIGVDVTKQGRGYGSALLRYALERCDRDHLPAYLEATSRPSKALYERHGFEELGVIQAGSSPPMWPMQRSPR